MCAVSLHARANHQPIPIPEVQHIRELASIYPKRKAAKVQIGFICHSRDNAMASVRFLLANEKTTALLAILSLYLEILKKAFFDYCFESIGNGLRFGRTLMNAISALVGVSETQRLFFCQQGEGALL